MKNSEKKNRYFFVEVKRSLKKKLFSRAFYLNSIVKANEGRGEKKPSPTSRNIPG